MKENNLKKSNDKDNSKSNELEWIDILDIEKEIQEEIIDNWDIFSIEEKWMINEDLNDIKIENVNIEKSIKDQQAEEIKRKFDEKMKTLTWKANNNTWTDNLEKELEEIENMMPNIYKWRPWIIENDKDKNLSPKKVNNNVDKDIGRKNEKDTRKIEEIRDKITIWDSKVVTKSIDEKRREKEKFNRLRDKYNKKNDKFETKKDVIDKEENIDNNLIVNKKVEILDTKEKTENINYKEKRIINETKKDVIEKEQAKIEQVSGLNENNNNQIIWKIISILYIIMFLGILIFAWIIYYNYFPIENKDKDNTEKIILTWNDNKDNDELTIDYSNMEIISVEWVIIDRYSDRYESTNDKKYKYLNTMNYWTLKIISKNNSKINCKWLIVVNGNIIESDIKDNETLNSSKILMVDDYECIGWLQLTKRYEFKIEHWYINWYLINPFENESKFKIWIDEITEKEHTLKSKEKVEFNFKLDCNKLFESKNQIEYDFRIYLLGEKSLYNRKIPFNITKDRCSAIEIEKLTIDQYWTNDWNTLKIPLWKPITISAILNNIWWLDLNNSSFELDIPSTNFDLLWEKNHYVSYKWAPTNRIIEIMPLIKMNQKKEVSITFTPIKAWKYNIYWKFKTENLMWLNIDFNYEIVAYQNWIEYTTQLTKSSNENKKWSTVMNFDIFNDNFGSDYKVLIYWPVLDSWDFDWYKLLEKNIKRKGEPIYYKKIISNDYYEQYLDTEKILNLQIILYDKTKEVYLDIIPVWDISKSKTIKIN